METEENESGKETSLTASLKSLQQSLFPPVTSPNCCSTSAVRFSSFTTQFLSNFYLKPLQLPNNNHNEDNNTQESQDIIHKTYTAREMFLSGGLGNREAFIAQLPRWPTECQVAVEERIKHISYQPPVQEPYYQASGKEVQPKPAGDECGVIVYQYTPISAVNYFCRSSVGGSRYLLNTDLGTTTNLSSTQTEFTFTNKNNSTDESLIFESRFECGNLERAVRITSNYYELRLRTDLYTNRHMQWYYFRVSRMRKNCLYRFSIVNFTKEESLYGQGMRPLMYSQKDAQLHSIGWRRCGDNITYYSNDDVNPEDPDSQMSYTLTFTTEFPHTDDEVYFAHCYPYSYSDLEEYLSELANHPIKSTFTTVRQLCKTLAGNNVYHVTITSPPNSNSSSGAEPQNKQKHKKAVVITARVHPGETPSSWMMKGFLDYLTCECSVARKLRERFIFKLVPMLNPDGVIVGNNRCSLAAKDLNRQYRTVMRETYPSIWYTKLMVRRLLEECGVSMYCDLHAHSCKHNIFIYGCENRRGMEKRLQEQVFPLMLHKNTPDKFSFESCKFRIQKAKEGTGRVVMWMMGIANSYTLETSFAGTTMSGTGNSATRSAYTHFTSEDFEQMAKSFCQTLLDFYDNDPKKERLRDKIVFRLLKEGSNADEPTNIRLSDYSSDEGDTSSSSSNEVGRDYDELIFPPVPPSTPDLHEVRRKPKPKSMHTRAKSLKTNTSSNHNSSRKPLPICKATLGLNLAAKKFTQQLSLSSEDELSAGEQYVKIESPKRRKKKSKAKQKAKKTAQKKVIEHYSDGEINYRNESLPQRNASKSISVLEILPTNELKGNVPKKRTKVPHLKSERRNMIAQQLFQVQTKLLAFKNRYWCGTGDGDEPLSWGASHYNLQERSLLKKENKLQKSKSKVKNQAEKSPEKRLRFVKKSHLGLRRQSALDFSEDVKCEPATATITDKPNMNDRKKKKKSRFVKKVQTITNANALSK